MTNFAVIFGAGNIGRGFIGQLFSESGYEVVFIDINEPLIKAINHTRCYPIHLVDNDAIEEIIISPVRAYHSSQIDEIADTLLKADIAATAVGARVLPYIAPLVAAGISKRALSNTPPLNIIICENLKDAATTFRGQVAEHIPPQFRTYFHEYVGFVDTVIGRMVPPPTEEMQQRDIRLIAVERYKELPVDRQGIIGSIPNIVGMQVCDNFAAYTARKLYIHNCSHAYLAYMGYLHGYEYGYQALADVQIRKGVEGVIEESIQAIVARYNVNPAWLQTHAAELLVRFANRALGDTILRLGRDPVRKLAPNDRLVGPARLYHEETGKIPTYLIWAIAAGYCFSHQDDPLANELQKKIEQDGFGSVLQETSGILLTEPLGAAIYENYTLLRQGRLP